MTSESGGYRAALGHPTVRGLWVASTISVVGDYVGQGALLLLAYERAGQRVIGAAALFAVGALPALLSGALAGSFLDRIPRMRALAGLQAIGALIVLVPVLVGGLVPVFVAAAGLGALRAAITAVRSGAMADGVPDAHRGPLLALLGTTEQTAQVLGYLTGATLTVAIGAEPALVVDTASFLVGAAILLRLPFPDRDRRTSGQRPPMTAGLRDIWRDRVLRLLGILVLVTATIGALPEVLAAGAARGAEGWTPVVLAAAPAGQAVTMLVLGRVPHISRPSVQLVHLAWLALALGVAALGRDPAWYAVSNFLVGSGVAWSIGPQLTFVRLAPAERMAQITGAMIAAVITAEGIGTVLFAALADATSVSTSYRVAGFVVLGAALIGWLVKERTPAALELDEVPAPADRP